MELSQERQAGDDYSDIHFFSWMAEAGITKKMLAAGISVYLKRDLRFETESEVVFDIYEAMTNAREETESLCRTR